MPLFHSLSIMKIFDKNQWMLVYLLLEFFWHILYFWFLFDRLTILDLLQIRPRSPNMPRGTFEHIGVILYRSCIPCVPKPVVFVLAFFVKTRHCLNFNHFIYNLFFVCNQLWLIQVIVCVFMQSKVSVYVAKCSYICHGWRASCHSLDNSHQRPETKGREGSKIVVSFCSLLLEVALVT